MKVKRYKIDEWVSYCRFPDSEYGKLKEERIRAVVLEVLKKQDIYDYRIYLDNGTSMIIKVREKNLFPFEKPN